MKKIFMTLIIALTTLLNINKAQGMENINYKWHLETTNASELHEAGINGKGVQIYVIDAGIDESHFEFEDLISEGRLIGNNKGFDIKNDKGTIIDDSHGTTMVSLIAGKTIGIAPESTIYYHRKTNTELTAQLDEFTHAINEAIQLKEIDIISISQAYTLSKTELENPSSSVVEAHNNLHAKIIEAKEAGILVIAAGGNIREFECYLISNEEGCKVEGNEKEDQLDTQEAHPDFSLTVGASDPSIDSVAFPAKFPEVLAVGAVEQVNNFSYQRSFNWGEKFNLDTPWTWSASATGSSIDVVSPGSDMLMAKNSNFLDFVNSIDDETKKQSVLSEKVEQNGSYYLKFDAMGTSSATAITTGVAALYKQLYPNTTAYELENMLIENAVTESIINDDNYFENQYGHGLIQAPNIGVPLLHTVNNRTVLKHGVYGEHWMFDGSTSTWFSSEFSNGDLLLNRFEKPVTVKGYNNAFDIGTPNKQITMTLYDINQNVLYSEKITSSTIRKTPTIENVSYIEFKNESGGDVLVKEFELLGDFTEKHVAPKKYSSTIDLSGTSYNIVQAEDWDDTNKHFDRFLVELGDETNRTLQWYSLEDDKNSIYKEDFTNSIKGQIVKNEKVSSPQKLFDDETYYEATFPPNGYVDYEFDVPVSISQLYIENSPKFLDNTLSITFYNSLGYSNTISIEDDELFERYVELSRTYDDVKKIRIQNSHGTQDIDIKEIGFYGKHPLTYAMPPVSYKKSIILKEGSYAVSDNPNSPTSTVVNVSSDFSTTIIKGYDLNRDTAKFDWIELTLPNGETKWLNTLTNPIGEEVFKNGLIDALSGSIDEENKGWFTHWMHNNALGEYPEISAGGYVTYTWNQPTSVNSIYLNMYRYIDNEENNFSVQLLDANQNVLYERKISRDDLYRQLFDLPEEMQNVYGFKIINNGSQTINIAELEFFK